ncbi:unnamed protein product [Prunus armeniaca]|uniref:Uncharacterized protein n=1 Tax=Prunus armeniaca TaxID=36596 RepID=A0A6J5VCE0_PRUAR|nr:unnamed protein product [Prunus armeniaca]
MCLLNILSGAGDEAVAQSTRACGKMEYMPNCQEKPICAGKNMARLLEQLVAIAVVICMCLFPCI